MPPPLALDWLPPYPVEKYLALDLWLRIVQLAVESFRPRGAKPPMSHAFSGS